MKYSLLPLESIGGNPVNLFSEKAEEIIYQIRETAFKLCEENELRLFIQNHQVALLRLREQGINEANCDEILHFLEDYFPRFLDTSLKVSKRSRQNLYDNYHSEILPAIIKINMLVSADFLTIIYPLLQLNGHTERTIERYLYQKKVITGFIKLMEKREINLMEICRFLCSHNYNHVPFIEYLINKIIQETSEEDYLEGRQEILFEYQKKYNQLVVFKGMNYDANLPSVKEQILAWLAEELKFSKRRIQNSSQNQTEIQFHKTSKFNTNLSVVQLSGLVRSLIDADVFTFKHEKDVFRAVAENFVTTHTKNISSDSLYNKQFTLESTTKESVKNILKEAIKSLNN